MAQLPELRLSELTALESCVSRKRHFLNRALRRRESQTRSRAARTRNRRCPLLPFAYATMVLPAAAKAPARRPSVRPQ